MKAWLIVCFATAIAYLPAILIFCTRHDPPASLINLGAPVMGFYPWAEAPDERGNWPIVVYVGEVVLTSAFATLAGVAIYKNSTLLAALFASLLVVSWTLLILRM